MRSALRRSILAFSIAALSSSPLAAQWYENASVLSAPTFTSLTFGSGASSRTVSQLSLPVVLLLPFGEKFSMDVSTAYASSTVKANDSTTSEISGLTDTQIRASYRIGADNVLLTVGINLPTGRYSVPEEQQEAAGQIGNDFLFYPISSMGNGLAMTGGVAYARPVGTWDFGAGASARKSTEFAAFSVASEDFRFTPADEYRLTMSADRPVGDGALSFGLTYSVFGEDLADTTTYSTGDRIIATMGWTFPVKGSDVFLSAWNLYRLEGEVLGADAPAENVVNLSGAVSIPFGEFILQPNIETRLWQVGGARAGNLINAGLRLRIPVGSVSLFPQVGYSVGNVYSVADGSGTSVRGLRASVTLRVN